MGIDPALSDDLWISLHSSADPQARGVGAGEGDLPSYPISLAQAFRSVSPDVTSFYVRVNLYSRGAWMIGKHQSQNSETIVSTYDKLPLEMKVLLVELIVFDRVSWCLP